MVARTKASQKKQPPQHFSMIRKMGFRDEVRCPCGAQRLVGGPDFQQWLDEHRECKPVSQEQRA